VKQGDNGGLGVQAPKYFYHLMSPAQGLALLLSPTFLIGITVPLTSHLTELPALNPK
jgi:hypothetical protein